MKINTSVHRIIITLISVLSCSCAGFKNYSPKNIKCLTKCPNGRNITLKVKCLSDAINKNPTYATCYALRGYAYKELMKFTSAIQDFRKVIELEPGNIDAYYSLVTAASLAGYKQYALYWLKRCIEAGFKNFQLIEADKNLDNLREMKEFNSLIEKWCQKPVSLN